MSLTKRHWMRAWALGATLALGCGAEEKDPDAPEVTVEFLLPVERAITRDEIGIALKVLGGAPDRVHLYVDESWLAVLDEASYRWDTRAWPEGEHTLIARAHLGERVVESKGRTVVVDRTPPRLVSMRPSPQAVDVAADAPIALGFSEPLLSSALDTATVRVEVTGEGSEMLRPIGLSEDRKTLLFPRPTLVTALPRTVSARFEGYVEDVVGNRAVASRDAAWSWQVPFSQRVGNVMEGVPPGFRPLIGGARPVLRLDGQGRPMVAWRFSPRSILVRRWDGTQWVTLPSGPAFEHDSTSSDILLDAEGRPTVAWVHGFGSPRSSVVTVRRWDGTAWTTLSNVGPNPEGQYTLVDRAALRITPSGLERLIWVAESRTAAGTAGVMLISQPSPGERHFFPLSQGTALLGQQPVVQMDDRGTTVAAWVESSGSGYRIAARRIVEGVSSFEDLSDEPRSTFITHPSLVLSPGEAVLAWSQAYSIAVRRWMGSTWTSVGAPVSTSTDGVSVSSALALDAAGRPLLAWSKPGHVEVLQWDGSDWKSLWSVVPPLSGGSAPLPVMLQRDATGSLVVAWLNPDADKVRSGVDVYRINR